MKKLSFLLFMGMVVNYGSAAEIVGATKKPPLTQQQKMQLLDDSVFFKAVVELVDGKNSYPKNIGTKQIKISDVAGFNVQQKKIVAEVTNSECSGAVCCRKLYCLDSHVLTKEEIIKIEKVMPKGYMAGANIVMDKRKPFFSEERLDTAATCTSKICCIGGSPLPIGCFCDNPIAIAIGGKFCVVGAALLSVLRLIKLVQPCICHERKQYFFEDDSSGEDEKRDYELIAFSSLDSESESSTD